MIKILNFCISCKVEFLLFRFIFKEIKIWIKSIDFIVDKYLVNINIILLKILFKSLIFCIVRNMGLFDFVVVIWIKFYRFVEKNGLKFKLLIV